MLSDSITQGINRRPAVTKETLYCSFCGKSQHEVKKLIAGPNSYICNECTELCMDIVREDSSLQVTPYTDVKELLARNAALPKPVELSAEALIAAVVQGEDKETITAIAFLERCTEEMRKRFESAEAPLIADMRTHCREARDNVVRAEETLRDFKETLESREQAFNARFPHVPIYGYKSTE
jgi:hypothetical protein